MSSYRKIDIEVRDEDISNTASYQRIKKENKVTEKIFIKKKKDHKIVSEERGTSVDEGKWEMMDGTAVAYTKYDPAKLFSEKPFGFVKIDNKIIGGGGVLGLSWWSVLAIVCVILFAAYSYLYCQVSDEISIANAEIDLWNNAKPVPTKKKELLVLDFYQKSDRVKAKMWKIIGM
jgi:hypothetical protein